MSVFKAAATEHQDSVSLFPMEQWDTHDRNTQTHVMGGEMWCGEKNAGGVEMVYLFYVESSGQSLLLGNFKSNKHEST